MLQCLIKQDAEIGFGVAGESYLHLLDAFYKSKFRFISARHEAGAAYMAEGYGKLTGKVGLCFVSRGPGACHAAIGVHTAMQNSTPMVMFVGQITSGSKQREAFQEIDYEKFFSGVAKWVVEVNSAERIPEIVARAFQVAQGGRKGPVVVSIPEDILAKQVNVKACKKIVLPKQAIEKGVVQEAMQFLAKAKSPLVLAGGGGWNEVAKNYFRKFVEKNHLSVVVAFRGQDILDNNSQSYCGEAGFGMSKFVVEKIKGADLLLAINVRFGEVLTENYKLLEPNNFKKTLIHCHAGIGELGKIFQPTISICATPETVCKALSKAKPLSAKFKLATKKSHEVWLKSIKAPRQNSKLDMSEVMQYINKHLPSDAIITNGAGNFAIWPGRHLIYGEKNRLLAPQAGAMGAGIPAAIAAKLTFPKRFVLCFAGDGDFQMSMGELGTALQQKVPLVILLVNNGMYGTIRLHQEKKFPRRISGTDIVNPDFVMLAKSYGMFAKKIKKTADFAINYKKACNSKTGALLELMVDKNYLTPHIKATSGYATNGYATSGLKSLKNSLIHMGTFCYIG